MRGTDHQQSHMFSYLSPEERVRKDHPLRAVREMVDEVLRALSPTVKGRKETAPCGRSRQSDGELSRGETVESDARVQD